MVAMAVAWLLFFCVLMMASLKAPKPSKRRHISHDGTIREYDYETREWTLMEECSENEDAKSAKPRLALEGRMFDINEYFPYLSSKRVMDLDALKTLKNGLEIKGHPLFIGNMANNGLKGRESEDQQHGDTGNNLWDTSILMAKCLEFNAFNLNENGVHEPMLNVSGKKVMELGSGTGLVGLSALHCDAKNVWMTDKRYCIENIRRNVRKNEIIWGLQHEDGTESPFERVSVFELDWMKHRESLLKYGKLEEHGVDVVIGSDIIWVKDLVPFLVETLQYLFENVLHQKHGIAIIAEQMRSNIVSDLFWNMVHSKGFQRNIVSPKLYHPDFSSNKVVVSIIYKQ